MQKLLVISIMISILGSCAVSSTKSYVTKIVDRPYSRILTLYVESEFYLKTFDSAFYEGHVRRKFNSLSGVRFVNQLEKTLTRNLSSKGTIIIKSTELFQVNDDVSYADFNNALEKAGIQAVLLVNLTNYWHSTSVSNDVTTGTTTYSEEPNATFNCYLFDWHSKEMMWLSNHGVFGVYASFDTL